MADGSTRSHKSMYYTDVYRPMLLYSKIKIIQGPGIWNVASIKEGEKGLMVLEKRPDECTKINQIQNWKKFFDKRI